MIKLIIRLAFFLLLCAGAYVAYTTYILKRPVDWTRFDFVALQSASEATFSQGATLAQQTWNSATTTGSKVLGESVQVQETESIPQKTFEYARYLYCQQVTQAWEKAHAPSPSP